MVKVIRYSLYGFKSQHQSHHLDSINYYMNEFDIRTIPRHLRFSMERIREQKVKFFKEHYQDFQDGVWCFIDGYKDNQSLNHLKQRVPCWEAEAEDDVEGYDCNWEKQILVSDEDAKIFGIYIPKRELYKIHNVSRRKSKKIS